MKLNFLFYLFVSIGIVGFSLFMSGMICDFQPVFVIGFLLMHAGLLLPVGKGVDYGS